MLPLGLKKHDGPQLASNTGLNLLKMASATTIGTTRRAVQQPLLSLQQRAEEETSSHSPGPYLDLGLPSTVLLQLTHRIISFLLFSKTYRLACTSASSTPQISTLWPMRPKDCSNLPRIGCGAAALASWEIAIDDGIKWAADYDVPSFGRKQDNCVRAPTSLIRYVFLLWLLETLRRADLSVLNFELPVASACFALHYYTCFYSRSSAGEMLRTISRSSMEQQSSSSLTMSLFIDCHGPARVEQKP